MPTRRAGAVATWPSAIMDDRERGTIAICFVHEALEEVRRRGLDAEAMLRAADIAPSLLAAPQARVSSDRYGALWHAIAQALDDEFFGMDSHPMKVGSFTLLCHAVIHSPTLERALHRALRFFRLILDDLAGALVREGETCRVVLSERPGLPRRAFAYGTFLLILHGLACWLVGRRIPLLAADFHCPEPPFSAEWRVLFSPHLNFDQAHSGISFPSEYLDMANIQNERTMKEFLRCAPANFLVKYKNSASLTARIRRRLREMPPPAWPDFALLAHQFHASPSTLRRRLEEEGQSYRSILDDLRRDMAITYLGSARLTVNDVAARLGFAEPSAFHRAFKKWTGGSPGEYRRAQGGDSPPM